MFGRELKCQDCGPLPTSHFEKYVESFVDFLLPKINTRSKFLRWFDGFFENLFLTLGILKKEQNFPADKISLRSTVFIDEAKKRGMEFWALKSPVCYINAFHLKWRDKIFSFEGLPRAEFFDGKNSCLIDDKAAVKKVLLENKIPTPEGKKFWFWQKRQALRYGVEIGFPLVVKPRSGSISHHVTFNIRNPNELNEAVSRAIAYEPTFIVEKYLPETKVFRITVVDFEHLAAVERIPAHITGDGAHSIRELVEIKNHDPARGNPRQKDTTLYKIVVDETSEELLALQNVEWRSIPEVGKTIYLQKKIILDLGADLREVTPLVHSDNVELFRRVASIFEVRLVGLDFLAEDISRSWKEQSCGIIELNSLPYIDMHHFPTWGEPVNVAGYVCDLVEKYYQIN
jgi:D-alanine-D-alanine ligase-like ATP-grasp enzyme